MSRSGGALDLAPIVPATTTVCAVELATLSAALRHGLGVEEIALLFASFHLGYLVADPLRRRMAIGTSALAAVTAAAAVTLCFLDEGAELFISAAVLLVFNAFAQAARRSLKELAVARSATKNIGKGIGMVLGGLLGSLQLGPIALMLFAVYFIFCRTPGVKLLVPAEPIALSRHDRVLLWGEFMHHMHYFTYCYVFWYLAPELISPMIGLWFLVGWLAYFVTELMWRETRQVFVPKIVAVGHLLVMVALLAMPNINSVGVLVAWFVTGVGGGTAYMLGNAGGRGPRERFEDAGHVCGVLAAAVIATVVDGRDDAATAGVLGGAFLALATAIMFTTIALQTPGQKTKRIGEFDASR